MSNIAKKKKDNFLSYGIDELDLDREPSQGEQEEIYRIDRNAYRGWKFWVTPEDELINIGSELHNNWALDNLGLEGMDLLDEGWIRITDDQLSGEILFDIPDFSNSSLKRVDDILTKEPGFSKFRNISIHDNKNFHVLRMSEVIRLGAERALRMYKKQLNYASKGKRVEIPMMFLDRYFGKTLDTQEFNGVRDAVANVLEKNEHYFLDMGAEPSEIINLEGEIKMAQTPGIFDTALEKLYEFGKKYSIYFKGPMEKGSAVTPSRVFHKLLTAWKQADIPNWVPRIDRALENVSIEFNDGTKMTLFDDISVDTFIPRLSVKAGKNKPNKVKKISYSDYKVNLIKYLFSKLGNYSVDVSDRVRLYENGYRLSADALTERQSVLNTKDRNAFTKVSFEVLAKHLDDYNTHIGHSLYSDTDVIIFKTSENIPSEGTDSEKTADEELLLINATVTALKNRGFDISAEDYIEWMTGSCTTNEGADRFNQVTMELLGEKVYNVYKILNLLNAKLRFELGVGPPYVDGVDLSINPDFSDVPEVDGCKIQSGEPPIIYTINIESII